MSKINISCFVHEGPFGQGLLQKRGLANRGEEGNEERKEHILITNELISLVNFFFRDN